MSLKNRLLLLILLFFVQISYFPINRIVGNGVILKFPIDDSIPLLPLWAFPYLLSLIWWIGCFIWSCAKMDALLYKRFVFTILFVSIICYFIYILYPTYVVRPEIQGTGFQFDLMRFIYGSDRSYNAFPSGHTYTTTIIMIFWWKWFPKKWWLWLTITVIVLISTLFTRQHYMPDILAGISIAFIGYGISTKLFMPKMIENDKD